MKKLSKKSFLPPLFVTIACFTLAISAGIYLATIIIKKNLPPAPADPFHPTYNEYGDNQISISPTQLTDPDFGHHPVAINFQPIVDAWVQSGAKNTSVLIYDLDRADIVASHNPDKNRNIASLYKLFVVYEGYRRVDRGEWDRGDSAGSTGYTILECLDLSIRASHSPCAEALWHKIGQDNLEDIVKTDFDITSSYIRGISSNATDLLKIMQLFYTHPDIKDPELVSRMQDSFLNQPITNGSDWRQGLPRGFSENVAAYNKVGWLSYDSKNWNLYHDAAIVHFRNQNRRFIIIALTENLPTSKLHELAKNIESSFIEQIESHTKATPSPEVL